MVRSGYKRILSLARLPIPPLSQIEVSHYCIVNRQPSGERLPETSQNGNPSLGINFPHHFRAQSTERLTLQHVAAGSPLVNALQFRLIIPRLLCYWVDPDIQNVKGRIQALRSLST